MKIILYHSNPLKFGGVDTFNYNFCKALKNKYHLKNYFLHATSLTFHNLKNGLAYLNNKTFIAPFFDWQEKLIKSLKEEGKWTIKKNTYFGKTPKNYQNI